VTTPSPRDVEALREELRTLGYLDARVDRLVLGGAVGQTSARTVATAASLRIGLLSGAAFGPTAAAALSVALPELVAGPIDFLLVALAIGGLFGMAAALVTGLAVGMALRASTAGGAPGASRAAALSRGAGFVAGAACLIYLALWWQTAALAQQASWLWRAGGIALAATLSAFLGHAVALTTRAAFARSGVIPTAPTGRRSIVALSGLVALSVAGAAGLLSATARERPPTAAPGPLTVRSTNQRVIVLAIDGVDLALFGRLADAGRLPVLARLTGGAAAAIPSDTNRDPARVWTTIATGQPPERHGVHALEGRHVAGLKGRVAGTTRWSRLLAATDVLRLTEPRLASGNDRQVPTFWEVAARSGLRTAAVHWWATWPAPDDAGHVITDRGILRLERGGAQDGEVAPESLWQALTSGQEARRRRVDARTAALGFDAAKPEADLVARSARIDATVLDLSADPALGPTDLLVLYLPGLDIVQHTLFEGTAGGPMAARDAASRVEALERYYAFLDRLIGPWLGEAEAGGALICTVLQPGRSAAPSNGLFGMAGQVAATLRSEGVVEAIAPTILYALGVPHAQDTPASPLVALFTDRFRNAHPLRTVGSYGPRHAVARPRGTPLDQEMIERMRALGYVR
jgi:hypothetical protein